MSEATNRYTDLSDAMESDNAEDIGRQQSKRMMEESRRNAATKHEQKASILSAFDAVDQHCKEMEDARIRKQQRIAEHFSNIRLGDPHIYHDVAINGFEDLKQCATKWSRLTRRNETHEDLRAKFKADRITTTDILNIGKALAKRDQVELSTEKDVVASSIFGDLNNGEADSSSAEDAMKQIKKAVLREVQVTIS
ncbi:hypothetical protein KC367_g4723 [Hortaea werneckii]|nr:hypothetical protein KC350_g18077 [Hortaea werneckii]KAI6807186.1 hypothetical protein KC358_g13509 [Hortaea werneckii]KAI6814205.1 hypothetical protein KC342_g16513 [Hortaea werneckii]KAI6908287.1 hypothetical protein KC348_g13895 [Hortaea werneckii]KAI6925914.1 hypothetical protein KC341_g13108 [Hortaea werneckii]